MPGVPRPPKARPSWRAARSRWPRGCELGNLGAGRRHERCPPSRMDCGDAVRGLMHRDSALGQPPDQGGWSLFVTGTYNRAADPLGVQRRCRRQFLEAAADRAGRDAGGLRYRHNPAITCRAPGSSPRIISGSTIQTRYRTISSRRNPHTHSKCRSIRIFPDARQGRMLTVSNRLGIYLPCYPFVSASQHLSSFRPYLACTTST